MARKESSSTQQNHIAPREATLRLTASRSNQMSYGSLCRRPKLVPVLEKRPNNSWLQMVCQTKGQQPKQRFQQGMWEGKQW